jgi:hypothetical protein
MATAWVPKAITEKVFAQLVARGAWFRRVGGCRSIDREVVKAVLPSRSQLVRANSDLFG